MRHTHTAVHHEGVHGTSNLFHRAVSLHAQVVLAEGPFFTGSTLKLRASRGLSPDFDMLRAMAGPLDVRAT